MIKAIFHKLNFSARLREYKAGRALNNGIHNYSM